MNGRYVTGIAVGLVIGIVLYFAAVFALPTLGELPWVYT